MASILGALGWLLTTAVAFALGLLVNFFSPTFSRWLLKKLSRLLHRVDKTRFDLSGTWQHTCDEPTPGAVTIPRTIVEVVKLAQLGNTVTGSGVTNIDPRTFIYSLTVNNNMVFGSYVKTSQNAVPGQQGSINGTGMVQLIVDPDRMSMLGQATWFDSDTQNIESAEVTWKRLP